MNRTCGVGLVACAVLGSACTSQSCPEVLFICDKTTIALTSPNDAWAAGMYTLALTMDGTPGQCTIQVQDPPTAGGSQGSCGLGATTTVALTTVDSCPPVVCKNGACEGMSCTPIPGRFQMKLVIQGMPAQVSLDLSRDGTDLMSVTIAPKDSTTGSAACGSCTNASATVSVAGG